MPWNASGTFNRVHDFTDDAAADIQAQADRFDAEFDGIVTGLENCQTLDGQTTPTAIIPMGGFKHAGVAAATSSDQYVRYDQVASIATTAAETAAGVTPTNTGYPPGDVRRYGALLDGASDDSSAFQDCIDVCKNNGIPMVINGSSSGARIDSQLLIDAGSGTRCNLNIVQDRNCPILSYVTGSIAGFDTAGFAVVADGWDASRWEGLYIDYTNGTAGMVVRCRKEQSLNNQMVGARFIGGASVSARETTTKIALRFTGNESVSGSTGYATYFNTLINPLFNIANVCVDLLIGDGTAGTKQPNAQRLIAPQFQRYMTACNFGDTDEHVVNGAWHHSAAGVTHGTNPTITQTGGLATVTHASHGYSTDDIVLIADANENEYNGTQKITVIGAGSYTYPVDAGASSPATGTITATRPSVGYRGSFGFSQIHANMEPGANSEPWYVDSGGTERIMFNVINNTGRAGVFEDETDKNTIIDGNYMSFFGQWEIRIDGTTDVIVTDAAKQVSAVPYRVPTAVRKRANVVAATNITYIDSAGVWRMTGATTINTITSPPEDSDGYAPEITLMFTEAVTVNDQSTSTGNIYLAAGADLSATANDTLSLVWNPNEDRWLEVSRSLN
jgi:hypothetical protein